MSDHYRLQAMGKTLEDFAIAADTRVRREIVLTLEALIELRLSLTGINGVSSQKLARLWRLYFVNQLIIAVMLMVLYANLR